jgi:hypothetical protein
MAFLAGRPSLSPAHFLGEKGWAFQTISSTSHDSAVQGAPWPDFYLLSRVLLGAERRDGALKFLEFLHFLLGLAELALFAM